MDSHELAAILHLKTYPSCMHKTCGKMKTQNENA